MSLVESLYREFGALTNRTNYSYRLTLAIISLIIANNSTFKSGIAVYLVLPEALATDNYR